MSVIVTCPSCGSKLRVADDLLGQSVRCPACDHIFESSSKPEPPPVPQDLPLELTIEQPSSAPVVASESVPGLVDAEELQSIPKMQPSSEPPKASRPPRLRELAGWDNPDLPRLRRRLDAAPDRGAIVLSLGIISVTIIFVWCAAPIGAILGMVAWIMGRTDLRKMKSGQMDDSNRSMTQAGWICGIIGTILNVLLLLGCGLFIGAMIYSETNRSPTIQPIPVTPRPAPALPRKRGMPRPDRPQDKPF